MSTTPVSNAGYYADFRGLDSLKKSAREHDPKAVRQAARQFESLLTNMLLKSMRQAKLGDGLGDSQETEFYQDMLDQQVAVQLSQGKGLGLADMLVQQLARSGLAATEAQAKTKPAPVGAGTAPPPQAPAATMAPEPAALPPAVPSTCTGMPEAPQPAPAAVVPIPAAPLARLSGAVAVPIPEQASFIRRIAPYAARAAERLGVAPEALIAHAALETGWGRHVPAGAGGGSSFNLFGIKASGAWNGTAVSVRTLEYDASGPSTVEQPFRAYASLEQGMDDYVNVLKGSARFRSALGTGRDTGAFANGLAQGGYATDPAYGSKLAAVADRVRVLRANAAPDPIRVADLEPGTAARNTADTRLAT
jgi:flagellar protein FlgJ